MNDREFDRDAVWVEQVLDLTDATVRDGTHGVTWQLASRIVNEEERLTAFANGLTSALERAEIDQAELARRLGTSKSTVGYWMNAAHLPADPHVVFAMEKALGCKPGELSQILGYLPLEAVRRVVSFDEAITASGLSGDSQRVIRRLVEAEKRTRGTTQSRGRG